MISFLCCVFILATREPAKAQSSISDKIKDPDFLFQPAWLHKDSSQSTMPLEKPVIRELEGLRKVEKFILLKGIRSSLRVNSTDSLHFIIKQGDTGMENIQELYKLLTFDVDVRKQRRQVLYHTYKVGLLGNARSTVADGWPLYFKKIREDVYLISASNPGKGEHAILFNDRVFTFGID